MKTIHLFIVCMLCLFPLSRAWAHALWIATDPTGKPGQAHEVRIYYGEPAEGVVENVSDWWSDVGSFVLTLHLPDGSSKALAVTAKSDHYAATFTPEGSGVYALSIAKPVAETFDGHKYQFNSAAFVNVGKDTEWTGSIDGDFRLFARPFDERTAGNAIPLDVQLDGRPLADLEVTVFSPNGWQKLPYGR